MSYERSQTEKDKHHRILCHLKKEDTNELILKIKQNSNRVTDVENKSMVTRDFPLVIREEINWETGVDICALLYIK